MAAEAEKDLAVVRRASASRLAEWSGIARFRAASAAQAVRLLLRVHRAARRFRQPGATRFGAGKFAGLSPSQITIHGGNNPSSDNFMGLMGLTVPPTATRT